MTEASDFEGVPCIAQPLPDNVTSMEPIGEEGLAAILLTDAVAFTRKVFRSEKTYLQILGEHLLVIEKACKKNGGEVLKNTGDGLLVFFPSAHRALAAAQEFQAQLTGHGNQNSYLHRVALHVGDVYRVGKDVLGTGVNATSRLLRACEPGAICVSQGVHELVAERHGDFMIRRVRGKLDNFENHLHAFHYHPRSSPLRTMPPIVSILGMGFLALGAAYLFLPTLLGWDALWISDYQRSFVLLLLASLAAVYYPSGVMSISCFLQIHRKPWKRPPHYPFIFGMLIYPPLVSLGLLQYVNQPSLVSLRDRWATIAVFFLVLSLGFGLFAFWKRPWSIFLSLLLFLSPPVAHAQLGTSLHQFEEKWDVPVSKGSDVDGNWGEYRKGNKLVRVWTRSSGNISRLRYFCANFDEAWKELAANQNGAKWWEREYFEPANPQIHRIVSTQWLRRSTQHEMPSARAVIAYELTSIYLFPPVCFFYRLFRNSDRPWMVEILPYEIETTAGKETNPWYTRWIPSN
jgi:class 3 adenylate cyclase